ncbi:MAG: BLUF domain-containing protein [Verrucomicrobiota bacterium]
MKPESSTESIFTICYISKESKSLNDKQVADLLTKAREKNRRLGVTGLLIYEAAHYMQVLEGSESVVKELFQKISQDERHHAVRQLAGEHRESGRIFGDWSMAYGQISPADKEQMDQYHTLLSHLSDGVVPLQMTDEIVNFIRSFEDLS